MMQELKASNKPRLEERRDEYLEDFGGQTSVEEYMVQLGLQVRDSCAYRHTQGL
jgi:hypothetical protein